MVWDLREEIPIFMFSQLKEEIWKIGLAFLVDVFEHLNNLNAIIPRKDLYV
jgi:hypothetical protein